MNEKESLQIISEMIAKAKASHHRKSYYFIIWGFALVAASLTEHIVVHKMGNNFGYFGWMAAGILGGIFSTIYSAKESKKKGHEAFMDTVYQTIWGGYGITLFLIIVLTVLNKIPTNPLVLIVTGLPVFISGSLTKFKPLQVGAFVFWILGGAAFFVHPSQTSLLFCAAIILGDRKSVV